MDLDFSVIIPTYRRPDALRACLRSLACQDYPGDRFEVLVCDDGGGGLEGLRDSSARCFARCTFLRQLHSGPAAARNLGARNARGRFLAFTDDDCEPSPGWLSALGQALRSQPDGLVGGHTINAIGGNLCAAASQQLIDFLYVAYVDQSMPRFLTSNNFALSSGAFASLGGFDGSFRLPAGEDRDFCSRWRSSGRPLLYMPTAVVHHSHWLTLRGFWSQHFRYGQGAHQLRRRTQETGRPTPRLEPPGFYLRLLSYPFTNVAGNAKDRFAIAILFVVSQTANACGFAREAMAWVQHRKRVPPTQPE